MVLHHTIAISYLLRINAHDYSTLLHLALVSSTVLLVRKWIV